MKSLAVILLIVAPVFGFGQTIQVDTKGAKVEFEFLADKTKGTLSDIKAEVTINPGNLDDAKIKGRAPVSTLSTGNNMRDKHLKSKSFFHAEKYPNMTFTSTSIYKEDGEYKAKGTLTIKETAKLVTFDVKNTGSELKFTTTINAKDFDVSPKKKEKSKVKVTVIIPM